MTTVATGKDPENPNRKPPNTRQRKPSPEEIRELRELFATKWLNVKDLRRLERESGKRFKRGKFSESERQRMREALKEYLDARGMTHQDFIDGYFLQRQVSKKAHQDKRLRQLFSFIAQRLDGRPVLMTYQNVRRMFHPGNNKGRWSPEEDAELRRLFEIHGPDWEGIGLIMGRYGMSARDRYKSFRGRGTTGPWSEAEMERLKEAVASVRLLNDDRPCWLLISEMVGTRSATQCLGKWGFLEMSIKNGGAAARWTNELDYYLVSRLYDLGVEHTSEIIWRDLVDDGWPVYFHPRILSSRFKLLRKRVRGEKNMDMDTLLETLMLTLKPLFPSEATNGDSAGQHQE